MNKDQIFQEVRQLFVSWYGEHLADKGACLYWTQCGMRVFKKHGRRAVLQAGTMLWQVLNDITIPEVPTHFGYQWDPCDEFSQEQMKRGLLPEIHIWIALPDENQIVDFSTGSFKKLCMEQHGLPWETPDPPEYFWGSPEELAQLGQIAYWPNRQAIDFAWRFILEKFYDRSEVREVCA
jgi:hypothetical protein